MALTTDSFERDLDTRLDGPWGTVSSSGLNVCPVCCAVVPDYCYINFEYIKDIKQKHIEWHKDQGF